MYKSIGIDEFEQRIKRENLSVIDVREVHEYQMGHVPGAINEPLSRLAGAKLTVDKAQEHYIICQAGSRSARACEFLSSQGYQVVNIMGGTSAWRGILV
ncbi:rhodanese-like domain-containing protein [Enterococcus olivae]